MEIWAQIWRLETNASLEGKCRRVLWKKGDRGVEKGKRKIIFTDFEGKESFKIDFIKSYRGIKKGTLGIDDD